MAFAEVALAWQQGYLSRVSDGDSGFPLERPEKDTNIEAVAVPPIVEVEDTLLQLDLDRPRTVHLLD